MTTKQISVRLNEVELAKVNALALGSSREEWFRAMIRAQAQQRAAIEELAIESFRRSAREALRRAEGSTAEDAADARREASEYNRLAASTDKTLDILRARG